MDNSGFTDNGICIFHQNGWGAEYVSIDIDRGRFTQNEHALHITRTKSANISKSTFKGSTEAAIRNVESFCTVLDNNKFIDNNMGILGMGTHPLSGGFQIGDFESPFNTFEMNILSVVSFGMDFPSGANVVNNKFDHYLFTIQFC